MANTVAGRTTCRGGGIATDGQTKNNQPYMKSLLRKLIEKVLPTQFPVVKHPTEYAFTIDGVKYYRFSDLQNMPYKRAAKCLTVYNELNMRVDRNFLLKHTEAVAKILSGDKISLPQLMEISKLNAQLRERTKWIIDADLSYKLATIVFFDESENPYDYDWQYNERKAKLFKAKGSDFFLSTPMQTLIPSLGSLQGDVDMYLAAQEEINRIHLESLSEILLSDMKTTSDSYLSLLFAEET